MIIEIAASAVIGAAISWLVKPTHSDELAELLGDIAIERAAADYMKSRRDGALRKVTELVFNSERQSARIHELTDKLSAIHNATVNVKNGTGQMVAKMTGTTPERQAIRANAHDMAISQGNGKAAGLLA